MSLWNKHPGVFNVENSFRSTVKATKVTIDKKALMYVVLFRNEDFHKFNEENGILVDDSQTYKGQLMVLKSNGEKVPDSTINELKHYVDSITQNLNTEYINIENALQKFETCKNSVVKTGSQYETMIDYADRSTTKLVLMGLPNEVKIVKYEVAVILGLRKPGQSSMNEDPLRSKVNEATIERDQRLEDDFDQIYDYVDPTYETHRKYPPSSREVDENERTVAPDHDIDKDIHGDNKPVITLDDARGSDSSRTPRNIQQFKESSKPPAPSRKYTHIETGVHVTTVLTDITAMNVDVVVNTTNSQLKNSEGVSFAIATAAGPALHKECHDYISCHGHLPVTQTLVTTAGNMPAKCVIHTVGPDWKQSSSPECVQQLYETFNNVLTTADKQKFQSIAIPANTSGIPGMPSDLVTETIVNSISDYLSVTTQTGLSHIYLVGVDKAVIRSMELGLDRHVKIGGYRENRYPLPAEIFVTNQPQADTSQKYNVWVTKEIHDPYMNMNPNCKHIFCEPTCPICGKASINRTLNQPKDGEMIFDKEESHELPGYEGCGVIVISYLFPNGVQSDDMLFPGQSYLGTQKTAYLPDNQEGNKVLQLLHRAFQDRLIFTIGRSRTTGADHMVMWNDIHHKTSMNGGPPMCGYPDPSYLSRVQEELAAKGITKITSG